ncbi:solute carrier family 35 member F5 [Halyomorpha halys]|uniref:solute carrier family 35 member F5 n=1 Tax=Halyomorpha halys TaxID=286706 RepID=UPI0006D5201C|nr:solute carrier family 35 member F5 [Halyomorpha halys]
MLNKSRRLLLGVFILLTVDVIWVFSSELTKYIYNQEAFQKPFFSTYIKTSMLTIYLLGLFCYPPWRDYFGKQPAYTQLETELEEDIIQPDDDTSLSPPTYVPIKWPEKVEKGSGTESDDSSLQRVVKFCKLAEVRHMSETNATDAFWARLSYQASLRAGHLTKSNTNKLSIDQIAKIALYFCFLWFLANYTFQAALAYAEASLVSLLSSSSSIFTLLLASIFPANSSDKFTLSKLIAVIISIVGLSIVSISDSKLDLKLPLGVILSLVSAFFYASYLVFLKRMVDNEEKLEIPMFFGFVGLFNFILLWPTFFVLHYCKWELFEWPNKNQWLFLIINGLIGTVLSEALWLWGCLLTSSLIATLALSLTIPLSIISDMILSICPPSFLFYIGSIPVIASFVFITFLTHYDNMDPVLQGVKKVLSLSEEERLTESEIEQRESLINVNEDHEA